MSFVCAKLTKESASSWNFAARLLSYSLIVVGAVLLRSRRQLCERWPRYLVSILIRGMKSLVARSCIPRALKIYLALTCCSPQKPSQLTSCLFFGWSRPLEEIPLDRLHQQDCLFEGSIPLGYPNCPIRRHQIG